MNKVVGIIEARMGSNRLPGKVLMPLGDKPVLQHIIDRVTRAKYLDQVIVATSSAPEDEKIAALCRSLGVFCFRGSEDDVLARVLCAAKKVDADYICELMGDSPFLDPVLIDQVIAVHFAGVYDFTANYLPENRLPMGFAASVFKTELLAKVADMTQNPMDRSHVTCFIYHNPQIFKIQGVDINAQISTFDARLCVDTAEDFALIEQVYRGMISEKGKEFFYLHDIIDYLRRHKELCLINKDIQQKNIEEG